MDMEHFDRILCISHNIMRGHTRGKLFVHEELLSDVGMLGSMLGGSLLCIEEFHIRGRKRLRRMRSRDGFGGSWSFPAVSGEEAANIGGTGKFHVVASLKYIKAVEGSHEAFMDKRWLVFARKLELEANSGVEFVGDGRIRSGKGKVIHLAQKEDGNIPNPCRVNVALMRSRAESELVKDNGDMFLPEVCCFLMTLESVHDREDLATINLGLETMFVPIGISVVHANKS
jgi:hypothetical protein